MSTKKNIRYFLFGQAITQFGNQIYAFAIGLYILRLTGSGLSFSINFVLSQLPFLILSPIGGVFADKFSRKKLIIFTDAISSISLFLFYFFSFNKTLELPHLYIIMIILSSMDSINIIAVNSSLPNLGYNDLVKLNSLSQMVVSLSRFSAPLIGGIIITQLDISNFLLINGLSFALSALLETRIVFLDDIKYIKKSASLKYELCNFICEIKEGAGYVKNKPMIFSLIMFSLFMNFFFNFGYSTAFPYMVNITLHFQPFYYGMIEGLTSLGAILASFYLIKKTEVDKYKVLVKSNLLLAIILLLFGMFALPYLIMSMSLLIIIYGCLKFIFGIAIILCNITTAVIIQSEAENHYRGRVMSLHSFSESLLTPIAVLFSGALIERSYVGLLPIVSGGFLIIATCLLRLFIIDSCIRRK